ncbi:MAG: hypothetical protein HFE64_02790 [Lachnospiraceae bacterium]|jgi:hypothetical protein|nr:hypothetical protein [Lachnospiraceae bacterium]
MAEFFTLFSILRVLLTVNLTLFIKVPPDTAEKVQLFRPVPPVAAETAETADAMKNGASDEATELRLSDYMNVTTAYAK